MEIAGKIILLLPPVTGEGKNGPWKKQDYILEMPGQYPKKVSFNFWGSKVDEFNLQVNDEVKVQVDIESREYNGKWYTDVKAWKAEKVSAGSSSAAPSSSPSYSSSPMQEAPPMTSAPPDMGGSEMNDDLPF